MPRASIVAVIAAGMLAAPVAYASPDVNDIAATKAFITDTSTFLTAGVTSDGRSKASVNAFIGHLASTCAGSLASGPAAESGAQRRTRAALLREGDIEQALAQLSPFRPSAKTYITRLERLHWDVPAVNHAVRAYLLVGRAALAIKAPDLCTNIDAAASTDFASTPAATSRLIKAGARADTSDSPVDIANLMVRFLAPNERRALNHLRKVQNQLDGQTERLAYSALKRIATTLGAD